MIGRQCVAFGAKPGLDHRLTNARVAVGALLVRLVQLHQLAGRGLKTRRRTQQQTALETCGGHSDVPTLAFGTDAIFRGHPHIVEEHFSEGVLAVECADRANGHPRCIEGHHQERQTVVSR
ncbi:hypothetical protein D3C77_574540 [compost metagenome]